jgi:GTP cyclohydrolase IA
LTQTSDGELPADWVLVESAEDRKEAIAGHMQSILQLLGYDVADQHFQRTPVRAAEVLWDYHQNGHAEGVGKFLEVQFADDYESLVMVGPVSVTSMCAHHMLPVVGFAWVGYLPEKHICGLSKLARVVDYFAHQLTVQEKLTQQVADALSKHLKPKGVMVVIKAEHGCMTLRGVREPGALTVTSAIRGVFRTEPDARAEFLSLMPEARK